MLNSVWGSIQLPQGVRRYGEFSAGGGSGLARFITNVIMLLIVVAGLYAVANFILAGYAFLSAGGDPKKIADAWSRIWQTLIGLIFVAGAFVLAGILSNIIYGNIFQIFQIWVYGPT